MAHPDNTVRFAVLHPDGTVTDERDIERADILACPYIIMMPEHYREDGSCRCDDPSHKEMAEWEYRWSVTEGRWTA